MITFKTLAATPVTTWGRRIAWDDKGEMLASDTAQRGGRAASPVTRMDSQFYIPNPTGGIISGLTSLGVLGGA